MVFVIDEVYFIYGVCDGFQNVLMPADNVIRLINTLVSPVHKLFYIEIESED